jgi:hypothetical protein
MTDLSIALREWNTGTLTETKVSTPLRPRAKLTFKEFSKLYDVGMAMKLTPMEECKVMTRTLQKIQPLKPIIRINVNRTKITDSRTGKTWYKAGSTPAKKQYFNQPTKENIEMSSQSRNRLLEMLTKKAAETAERKRREDSGANRFMNTDAVDDYISKRAAEASAIATAAEKMTLHSFTEKENASRPADTPTSATMVNKPNVQKSNAENVIKQHVININLDLPTPEQLGFGHSPTQKPAVQQRTPNFRYPGVKTGGTPAPGEKQQFPKKPKGDTGSNIESGRGYY